MKNNGNLSVKRTVLLLLLGLLLQRSDAQDAAPFNKVSVNVINPLQFTYVNAVDLLNPKIIHNALELAVKVKQENTNIYAQVVFSGGIGNAANLLSLRLTSKTSPDAIISNSTVPLSDVPALLLMQPKSLQNSEHYSFYYDLILNPSSIMIPPGNYGFSINFTITAQ